jgi:predicted nucleic acid-binding protein
LAALATERAEIGDAERAKARALHAAGLGVLDALHWVAAEAGGADVLLTTDDRFERRATRIAPPLVSSQRMRVRNPLTWVTEELTR